MKITLFRDLPTEHWYSMERYADELELALGKIGCDVRSFVARRPFPRLRGALGAYANHAWRSIAYPIAARSHQADVNHIIDHSYAHLIATLDPCRTIVTCHDVAPLALGQGSGISRRLWNRSFRAMLRAARIIADSTFTRDEILRHAAFPAERISVVPLAVSPAFFERVAESDVRKRKEKYGRFILHVGSCAPRKNVEVILRTMARLCDLDFMFVQIGGVFSGAQMEFIRANDLGPRVVQIAPTFGYELSVWYQSADVFVFSSLYEGFGMPVIEAMASRTPVVCSNASSLPEIAGDAALLIDPTNPSGWVDAIRSVLNDSQLANTVRERGAARAKLFTWDRTARETLGVYQQVAA